MVKPSELIRGRILLAMLLAAGVVAALVSVAQLWWSPFAQISFLKTLATIGIVGFITGFVAAVDIELTLGKARLLLLLLMGMATITGILTVAQMWWSVLEWDSFVKILLTLGVFMFLDGFVMAVAEDFGTTRKLKDDKYID